MASLTIRLRDAVGNPLADRADVHVRHRGTGVLKQRWRDRKATGAFKAQDLVNGQVYQVRAFPARHRPVGRFVPVRDDTTVELSCPVHPDRVTEVRFADYAALGDEFHRVMANSATEGHPGRRGEDLYTSLHVIPRAGLLNLFAKMSQTPVLGRPAWSYLNSLYRIRGDRIFADVANGFRDDVKSEVAAHAFHAVSGAAHEPEDGFAGAGSFKSDDPYGNLQLTFFSSKQLPLSFKVDADVDDAAGIEHAFQVLRNWAAAAETHPYDIHQILAYHQGTVPAYELIV